MRRLLILVVTTTVIPSVIHGWTNRLPHTRLLSSVCMTQQQQQEDSLNDQFTTAAELLLSRQQFGNTLFRGILPFLVASTTTTTTTTTTSSAANAMMTDPKTGIALPEEGEIEGSIPTDWNGVDNPFGDESAKQFGRLDSTPDSIFYTDPRFVEHVDEQAVQSMTTYISQEVIPKAAGDKNDIAVLDLCSSWTSHIDLSSTKNKYKRISGLGMNAKELEQNTALNDWVVRDLNDNPTLPYEDDSFDVVLCQLSIDYLTKPKQVLKEVSRVLRPGGSVHILFSNRLFLSKAVALWTGADDIDHAYTVGCYLHFCDGGYKNIQARDLSTRKGRERRMTGDPLYVVTATR